MNAQKKDPVPKAHLAEACVWVTRLHGDDRDPAMEDGFREWLRADPLNARAFERTTAAWDDSINLRRVVPFAHDATEEATFRRGTKRLYKSIGPHSWGRPLAIAASLLVAVGAFFLYRFYFADGYTTAVGEQKRLVLKDGTRVFLNTATRVIDQYDENQRRIELKSGEALFEVAKEAARPFIVQVGDRQIRALGTSFVVRRDARELAVTLMEGKVAVSDASGSGVAAPMPSPSNSRGPLPRPTPVAGKELSGMTVLKPGERVTFARTTRLARIDTPSLEAATAWRRGQVVFDETPLADAVAEMNRYSSTKLVAQDPKLTGLRVSGYFQAGSSASFAKVIAEAFGLEVENSGGAIVLR